MAGKEQFDELLGGTQALPFESHIMKLVSARASEIAAMTHCLENPQQTKLVFQKLPMHMRRRVMSHNAKRLPRKLREAHTKQMKKSGLPPKSKRPSRKYRRRPRNLLAEYNRRRRNKVWLETHIWHAKRFHMVEKWGYRIASHANDKCFRANYRAVAKHCLMQDISYYACVEVTGPESLLKETLKTHCSPYELSFGAKVYAAGSREGVLMFFRKNGFPQFPIGNVSFLWRPNQSDVKTIWIWVHPAFYSDFLGEIVSSFQFEPQSTDNKSSASLRSEPCFYKNEKGCQMVLLKNVLNRFRLYGPLAIDVLTDALQLPNLDRSTFQPKSDISVPMDISESKNTVTSEGSTCKSTNGNQMLETLNINLESHHSHSNYKADQSWNIEYYSVKENLEILKQQKQQWQLLKTLGSPNQLPPNIVLGFTVLDSRFYLPEKRTKSRRITNFSEIMSMPPTNSNCSPIWETAIRDKVTKSCVLTGAINKLRSECLVPGIQNDKNFDEDIMAKIPVLVIQKPGDSKTGFAASIDIVLPAGWAMSFWLALIYRCARPGALRESRSIAFESSNVHSSDVNEPDTAAYEREAVSRKSELTEKYFRYPPNRRVNFVKFGISSPFFCEWKILTKEWTGTDEFYVLRNRDILSKLHLQLSSQEPRKNRKHKLSSKASETDLESLSQFKNCLVRVKVSVLKRGCPKDFALICMPTAEDLQKFENNKNWSGPVEKLNPDPNESRRRILRKNHLILLKRLRRQRVRHKRAMMQKIEEMLRKKTESANLEMKSKRSNANDEIKQEHRKKMLNLYLPECSKVRRSCNREVMGYVTMGAFSFIEACGLGIGYIVMQSLIEMTKNTRNIVLVRNIQTRQYRFAKLDILL